MGIVNQIQTANIHDSGKGDTVEDVLKKSKHYSPEFWDGDPASRWSTEWIKDLLGYGTNNARYVHRIVDTVDFIYRACDVDGRLRVVPTVKLLDPPGQPQLPVIFNTYFEGQPFIAAKVRLDARVNWKQYEVTSPRIRNYRHSGGPKHYINSTNKWSRAQDILARNIRLEPDESLAARMLSDVESAWWTNEAANKGLLADALKDLLFGADAPRYYGISDKLSVSDLPPLKELYHAIQGGYIPSDGTLAGKFSRVLELERASGAPPEAMTFVMSRHPEGAKLLVVNRVNAMNAPNQPPSLLRHRKQLVYGTRDWTDANQWSKDMDWAHVSRLTQKVVVDPDTPYMPQVARLRTVPVALVEVSDLLQQVPVSFRDRLLAVYSLKDETEMPGWGYRHDEDNMCIYGSPY